MFLAIFSIKSIPFLCREYNFIVISGRIFDLSAYYVVKFNQIQIDNKNEITMR
jgi:hypothetical protein